MNKMTDVNQPAHSISLRVLRLSAPTFSKRYPLVIETTSTFSEAVHVLQQTDLSISNEENELSSIRKAFILSDIVELPVAFGNVHLGQLFRCLIVIKNEAVSAVKNVMMKTEIHTENEEILLQSNIDKDRSEQKASLETMNQPMGIFMQSSEVKSWKITYEMKEVGIHTLICQIDYVTMKEEQRSVKKFFKFKVINPLAVKTRIVEHKDQHMTYLEAQLVNTSKETLQFDRIELQSVAGYECSIVGKKEYILKSDEIAQVLFKVRSKESWTKMKENTIGHLDLYWKTMAGDREHLQTLALQRKKFLIKGDIEISLQNTEAWLHVNMHTRIQITLKNVTTTEHRWTLRVQEKDKQGSIAVLGILDHDLPILRPGESTDISVEVIALQPGLATGPLRIWITDWNLMQTLFHDILLDIYIQEDHLDR
jgi:hypothetical protein